MEVLFKVESVDFSMPRLYLQNKNVIWHKLWDQTEQVFVQRDHWEGALDGEKRGLLAVTSVPGSWGLVWGEGLRLRGQKEGLWPRPTPWPVDHPGTSLSTKFRMGNSPSLQGL